MADSSTAGTGDEQDRVRDYRQLLARGAVTEEVLALAAACGDQAARTLLGPGELRLSDSPDLAELAPLSLIELDLTWRSRWTNDDLLALSYLRPTSLSLASNRVTKAGLTRLAELPLERLVLVLDCGPVGDAALEVLGALPLEHLSLRFAGELITDRGVQALAGTPLRHLDLYDSKLDITLDRARGTWLTEAVLDTVASLPLDYLDLGGQSLGDTSAAQLSTSKLRYLGLGEWSLTPEGLATLHEVPLRYLNLEDHYLTDDHLRVLVEGQPQLTGLGLRHTSGYTAAGLASVFSQSLEVIDLCTCHGLRAEGVELAKQRGVPVQSFQESYSKQHGELRSGSSTRLDWGGHDGTT